MYKILSFSDLLTKLNEELEKAVIKAAKNFSPKNMGIFSVLNCQGYGWDDNSTATLAATQLIQLWNEFCIEQGLPQVEATENLINDVAKDMQRMAKKPKSEHKLCARIIEKYRFQSKLCPGGHKSTQEVSDHLNPSNPNFYQNVFRRLHEQNAVVVNIERLDSSKITDLTINEAQDGDLSVSSLHHDVTMGDSLEVLCPPNPESDKKQTISLLPLLKDKLKTKDSIKVFRPKTNELDQDQKISADDFSTWVETMLRDHEQQDPNKKFIMAADIYSHLFKETKNKKGTVIKRELRPGVLEVLETHDLVLTVPSDLSETNRAIIQDRLKSNANSTDTKDLVILNKRIRKIISANRFSTDTFQVYVNHFGSTSEKERETESDRFCKYNFSTWVEAMLMDHEQQAPNKEFIVAADINLYLFKDTLDDKGTIIKRELRSGVLEVLVKHDLVLTVPSGQSEISRASIQDQLHKITSSKRPKPDSLILLQKRHKKIHSLKSNGSNSQIPQDVYTRLTSFYTLQDVKNPFGKGFLTDHPYITVQTRSGNVVLCNGADGHGAYKSAKAFLDGDHLIPGTQKFLETTTNQLRVYLGMMTFISSLTRETLEQLGTPND